jgi:hypothetical protein
MEGISNMLTPQQAAEAAMNYLLALSPDLLGGRDEPRLEEISKEDAGKWHVVLSYMAHPSEKKKGDAFDNKFANSLMRYRLYKEFVVDANSGSVLGMKNPANA